MKLILERRGRHYFVEELSTAAAFAPPTWNGAAYACLIWDSHGGATESERTVVAEALLDSGCRYVVCGGLDCEAWHDSVDDAYLVSIIGLAEVAIEPMLVMTTWHTNESEEDVVFFFVHNTDFLDVQMKYMVLVHIGDVPRTCDRLQVAIGREAHSFAG
jgi:hypothetical protein